MNVQLKDGRPVTTSRTVAEVFGKAHKHILRDIEALECSQEFIESNFGLYSYKPEKAKRSFPAYEITRDGFVFLCMGLRKRSFYHRQEGSQEAQPLPIQGAIHR